MTKELNILNYKCLQKLFSTIYIVLCKMAVYVLQRYTLFEI